MLPSGNDAALTLATAFGKYIHFSSLSEKRKYVSKELKEELKTTLVKHFGQSLDQYHLASFKLDNELYIMAFVGEMNKQARVLKIEESTRFSNPHGLSDKNNHSTPSDVCKMTAFALRLDLFRDIVSKRFHECITVSYQHNVNMFQWFNSNKLLNDYFKGVKTGTTPTAGPCLTTYFVRRDF